MAYVLKYFTPVDVIYNMFRAELRYLSYKKHFKSNINLISLSKKYSYQDVYENQNTIIVLVIGEALRVDHWSLSGYKKNNTTSSLQDIPNLFNFKEMDSCWNYTSKSLLCMMTRNISAMDKITETAVTSIFHNLNYKLSILSLQDRFFLYNYFTYDRLLSRKDIIGLGNKLYDKFLLPEFKKIITNSYNKKQFIIIHGMGSHSSYLNRVDIENDYIFKPYCSRSIISCSFREVRNIYDSTVLATSNFLANIIKIS